ncbi:MULTISPECIES: LysM peptidoglycan-binding domain-containing protein [Cupriavidus]
MAAQEPVRTGFEKWQDGLDKAAGDAKWSTHDCEVQIAVNEFNRHLSGKAGYMPLDWRLIKAMLWTESGAASAQWSTKPMQIGVAGDPGLASFLSGDEGGELILPPAWKGRLTEGSVRSLPSHNIRAGIGYLLMRMARFEHRNTPAADATVYEVTVKAGDSIERIARHHGSTPEMIRALNPAAGVLRPGQVLKYRKASIRRGITGWRDIGTDSIAQRYNGGGDPNYGRKLEHALGLVRKEKAVACVQ